MAVKVHVWMPAIDTEKSSLAKSLGLVKAGARDSLLGIHNGVQTRTILGLLHHGVAGSARGSLRILNRIREVTGLSFGHAAVELTDDYIGYWPPFRDGIPCTAAGDLLVERFNADINALMALEARTPEQEHMLASLDEQLGAAEEYSPYQQELLVMGRPPTHTIELPNLDEDAMSDYFRTTALQREFAERTHNCCTVSHNALFTGLSAMERKMSFWERLQYETSGTLRIMGRPIQTTIALAAKASGTMVVFDPEAIRIMAQFLRDVVLT